MSDPSGFIDHETRHTHRVLSAHRKVGSVRDTNRPTSCKVGYFLAFGASAIDDSATHNYLP